MVTCVAQVTRVTRFACLHEVGWEKYVINTAKLVIVP